METRHLIQSVVIGAAIAFAIFLLHLQGLLMIPELKTLDLRFRMRGPIPPKVPIVLVSIDQDSFDELGLSWPWPRTVHAELLRRISTGRPRIVGLDILFTEPRPDPTEDQALSEAIREAGNVILAAEMTEVPSDFGPRTTINLPIPIIRDSALGYGIVNLMADPDGIVRRARPALRFQDRLFPGFAYRIFQNLARNENKMGEEIARVPYLINFRGPARTYPVIPYYRILRNEIGSAVFRDKIVIVGAFSPSLHDLYPTPFSADQPTAGAEMQANFVETLLANDRSVPLSEQAHALGFLLLCLSAIWTAVVLKPLRAFFVILILAGGYSAGLLYLFSFHQLWVPATPAFLGIASIYGGITLQNYIREQKERIRLRAIFSRYVSPDVVDEILKNRHGLALGGKRRQITVLFSDIRGFTSLSEQITPEQVVTLLSDYLAHAVQIVFKHGGTIDKFMGDAVMAIFGAPKSYEDNALRAVSAGLDLVRLAESKSPEWARITGRPLVIGVGINSGEAVVGSIGSEIRSDFTAIGDTVNLASRLEALTKELKAPMLISESTAEGVKTALPLRALGQVKVSGREAPLLVYCPESLLQDYEGVAEETTGPYVQKSK
ncbi:MAG: adenylate/guanylate cyclase domain-containing protein [Deltaproteobacteria bacterium]|nr:adenylate/guanylate cyclase domain-containing protein [Deltaproteobacteria bacterium]